MATSPADDFEPVDSARPSAPARVRAPDDARASLDRRRTDGPWRPQLPFVIESRASKDDGVPEATESAAHEPVPRRGAKGAGTDGAGFWCAPSGRLFFRRAQSAYSHPSAHDALRQPDAWSGAVREALRAIVGAGDARRYGADEALRAPARRKRIVICADGTWNAPDHHEANGEPAPTNVWLLYQLLRKETVDATGTPVTQLAYYHRGIGTGGLLDRIVGGLYGAGITRNVLDCYRVLVTYYNPGDEVFLFGFSRGAYTVRSLAGLVRNAGVIARDRCHQEADEGADQDGLSDPDERERRREAVLERRVQEAWALYRDRSSATSPTASRAVDFRVRYAHDPVSIAGIGVWDTVGALGIPNDGPLARLRNPRDEFHDVRLSANVRYAFHAIALDERRGPFVPTLWEQPTGARDQVLEQRWFPGVHADVGGGYPRSERGLATVTLRWMCDRLTRYQLLDLDAALLDRAESACPGRPVVHNSLSPWFRIPLVHRPRVRVVDGGLGVTGARDPDRRTTEYVDAAAHWCVAAYPWSGTPPADGTAPCVADVPDGRYAPESLADYLARCRAQVALADAAREVVEAPATPSRAAASSEVTRRLKIHESTPVVWVRADRHWNDTGLDVGPGEAYEITAHGVWYDRSIACAADGYDVRWEPPSLPWWRVGARLTQWSVRQAHVFCDARSRRLVPSRWSRRYPEARWFALVAAVGRAPESFRAVAPGARTEVPVNGQRGFTARIDVADPAEITRRTFRYDVPAATASEGGAVRPLELFANDLPGMYGNNSGALAVVVRRVR